jgi:hypothetical protein
LAERECDSVLVSRTLRGDQRAFGELVARYREAVVGVAFSRVGCFEETAETGEALARLEEAGLASRLSDGKYEATELGRMAVLCILLGFGSMECAARAATA